MTSSDSADIGRFESMMHDIGLYIRVNSESTRIFFKLCIFWYFLILIIFSKFFKTFKCYNMRITRYSTDMPWRMWNNRDRDATATRDGDPWLYMNVKLRFSHRIKKNHFSETRTNMGKKITSQKQRENIVALCLINKARHISERLGTNLQE